MWKKTTNRYVADVRKFETRGRSLVQLAKYGLIVGVIWGVMVVFIYGLPGDKAREYRQCQGAECIK
jgi:hypothetical protein